ncbi:uncharacterized protein GGS25DRAFT_498193 [Hypoxylon fragiforme]|uniref:uncharacterized protein n=1 Tax=Hypoxylon fragiforme TaxID=63214 RepID=UPI0020C6B0CE|nr:uncharacterized protein GGS25DRAFT_498193 [Hypoxylon fragiforme]KAI2605823.1 hypothetical protein GGS25DRAFT_498193 [Hypoxylon fragiforme]
MPKTKAHMRSSRRAPVLRDSEIDHEISLVDHSVVVEESQSLTPETTNNIVHSPSTQPLISNESRAPSTQPPETEDARPSNDANTEAGSSGAGNTTQAGTVDTAIPENGEMPGSNGKNITKNRSGSKNRHARKSKELETAIDILYENQRGGFLCGIPLFSAAALGNLDPTPWTNFAHRPSPTDITTAQVPDPSWEWSWPEWRVNHDEAISTDGDGWEYSFMFSKKFSWHGPKWYNSFVRRRAWIRGRIKKGRGYEANELLVMGPNYFSVTPTRIEGGRASISQQMDHLTHDAIRRSHDSRLGDEHYEPKAELTTMDELIAVLRRSRIDRENLDAMENYIEHCSDDLKDLPDHMHEIMSVFVFQASRKLLLARLIKLHDDQVESERKGKSIATKLKAENLAGAIKHADEELRRLEYWSDIKGMAESGESRGAADCGKGWGRGWEGVDNSGPKGVRPEGEPL